MEPKQIGKIRLRILSDSLKSFIVKKTKKNEKEVDIRPYIYEMRLEESRIFLEACSRKRKNTKPELVMEAFLAFWDRSLTAFALQFSEQRSMRIREQRNTEILFLWKI